MNSVKVLDVTLRDGGCVNNFNFGQEYMDTILSALERSGVDIIELGYLNETKGSERGRTEYCNEQVIEQHFLKKKLPGITYVAMMDYGKFNVDLLKPKTGGSIDGIRLAFHKKNWRDMIPLGQKILQKGYQFYIQPMLTLRYSDVELLELIQCVNEQLPDASGFYIVDSFGEMRGEDVTRLLYLVDKNLNPSFTLGIHSHNNLQLSYSNAMSLLEFPTSRNLILDSSVMGMGKGAGNLNTELLLEHMNLYYKKNYKIAPLLEVIDEVINVIHKELYWGYSVEYYLSSVNHCTPSYASHFYNKHMLPIDQVAELLDLIKEEKKLSFDKEYAERLYLAYNTRKAFDDSVNVDQLQRIFQGKRALVIAPGKSIKESREVIQSLLRQPDIVSISLNNLEFETNYVFTTRVEMYQKALECGKKIIVPSNIFTDNGNQCTVIDYQKWIIEQDGVVFDSSGVMALMLLNAMHIREFILAGFDGFSVNINDNYFDTSLRKPVTDDQAVLRNRFYKDFICNLKEKGNVTFITPSVYE